MTELLNFLTGTSSIYIPEVVVNVILAIILAQLVYGTFVRFGNTFSNRRQFGKIFLLVTVSTTIIISIIQASLALSLGLVGALSIVRFRTAIKEPEELAYTFFAITIGIGCGANARGLTIVCTLLVLAIVAIRGLLFSKELRLDTYNFSVVSQSLSLTAIQEVVAKHSLSHSLRRSDSSATGVNIQYVVEFANIAQLETLNRALKQQDGQISTSFVSNSTFT